MKEITKKDIRQNFDIYYNFEYGATKGEATTDYAELWIKHEGINKLERNINNDVEIITAIVHFIAGTRLVHDYCFYVHNTDTGDSDEINVDLSIEELTLILETAWQFIHK